MLPICAWAGDHPLEHGESSRGHIFKEEQLSSSRSCQQLVVPQEVTELESLCFSYAGIWVGLILWWSCAGTHCCYEQTSARAMSSHGATSCPPFFFFFHGALSLGGDGSMKMPHLGLSTQPRGLSTWTGPGSQHWLTPQCRQKFL